MATVDQAINPFINSMQWNPTQAGATAPSESAGNTSLGQEEFLELMTAQLENQDPFKPMENADFIGQMAQFGTVSGIGDLQTEFAAFTNTMKSQMLVEASNIVGKSVLTKDDIMALPAEGEANGLVKLASNVDNVTINIENEAGELVRSIRMGGQSAGDMDFTWDGNNDEGIRLPEGNYKLNVTASARGETQGLSAYVYGEVESVSMGGDQTEMVLHVSGVGAKSMDDVVEIAKVGN